jgi:hypothetical protein
MLVWSRLSLFGRLGLIMVAGTTDESAGLASVRLFVVGSVTVVENTIGEGAALASVSSFSVG